MAAAKQRVVATLFFAKGTRDALWSSGYRRALNVISESTCNFSASFLSSQGEEGTQYSPRRSLAIGGVQCSPEAHQDSEGPANYKRECKRSHTDPDFPKVVEFSGITPDSVNKRPHDFSSCRLLRKGVTADMATALKKKRSDIDDIMGLVGEKGVIQDKRSTRSSSEFTAYSQCCLQPECPTGSFLVYSSTLGSASVGFRIRIEITKAMSKNIGLDEKDGYLARESERGVIREE
ncbi:hypothetical protein BTVI_54274 [Pitangus sulphuratus]|nr:hypothetical protein BTVI_54274 [Pitangus sulphuratus]